MFTSHSESEMLWLVSLLQNGSRNEWEVQAAAWRVV